MNKVAIICEYNPLHSGHEHLLRSARERFFADEVYCIMSGSFVQRGEPAVCDRFTRALWAINSGADLVAEMPGLSGSLPADDFALMGVLSAERLGATHLLFGSECGNIEAFIRASAEMDEPTFKARLMSHMAEGLPYPAAVAQSLDTDLDMEKPNNLLGLSYVNAIRRTGSSLIPLTLKRIGDYHAEGVKDEFMSASAIRRALSNGEDVTGYINREILGEILPFNKERLPLFKDFCLGRAVSVSVDGFRALYEVEEGLENRLIECAKSAGSPDEYLSLCKTKRYTLSRLRRIMTYLALDITKDYVNELKTSPYLRVLAVRKSEGLLSHLAGRKGVYLKYGSVPKELKHLWQKENAAARLRDLFSQGRSCQNGRDNAIIIS